MKNKDCILYYSTLKGLFPFMGIKEIKFLRDVKMQLRDFSILHPNCTYKEISAYFGLPEEIFKDYINSQGVESFSHKAIFHKKLHLFLDFLILIVIVIVLFIVSFYVKVYKEFEHSQEHISETIIDKGVVTYD